MGESEPEKETHRQTDGETNVIGWVLQVELTLYIKCVRQKQFLFFKGCDVIAQETEWFTLRIVNKKRQILKYS